MREGGKEGRKSIVVRSRGGVVKLEEGADKEERIREKGGPLWLGAEEKLGVRKQGRTDSEMERGSN